MTVKASKKLSELVPITLRRLRLEKGISQEELSHISGLDRTYISSVERFRRNMSLKSLDQLVSVLSENPIAFLEELLIEAMPEDGNSSK
jgi:transcriptional regulator with XRE-family HTH domain